ncbi:Hypothetical_protein [Hexamita inflata]|uniref:Hypothetical_protein n=1 Tax=Hexamita inflata TaxID=28002 RepID=A0AA86Q3Y9_9EUKA|nr:Hypothetical protein HINF_LOCUS36968 [Hexamita inflata]
MHNYSYQSLPPVVLKTCTSSVFDKRVPSLTELSCTPSFGRLPKSYLSTNVKQYKHVEDFHDLYQNQNVEVDDLNTLIDNCNLRTKIIQMKELISNNRVTLQLQQQMIDQIEDLTYKHEKILAKIENYQEQNYKYFKRINFTKQ